MKEVFQSCFVARLPSMHQKALHGLVNTAIAGLTLKIKLLWLKEYSTYTGSYPSWNWPWQYGTGQSFHENKHFLNNFSNLQGENRRFVNIKHAYFSSNYVLVFEQSIGGRPLPMKCDALFLLAPLSLPCNISVQWSSKTSCSRTISLIAFRCHRETVSIYWPSVLSISVVWHSKWLVQVRNAFEHWRVYAGQKHEFKACRRTTPVPGADTSKKCNGSFTGSTKRSDSCSTLFSEVTNLFRNIIMQSMKATTLTRCLSAAPDT